MDINIEQKMNAIFEEITKGFIQMKKNTSSEIERDLLLDQIKKFYVLVKKNHELNSFESNVQHTIQSNPIESEPIIEFDLTKTPDPIKPIIESKTEIEKTTLEEAEEPSSDQKISTSKIMDFLHKEELPKREISEFLDFNTRIGLVQNFFNGNALELSECLMAMNKSNSESESIDILQYYASKQGIDSKSDTYLLFLDIIKRRYR